MTSRPSIHHFLRWQEDLALARRLPEAQAHKLRVLRVPLGEGSLQQLWSAACGAGAAPEAPLLLLPEGYALLPGAGIPQVGAPAHAAQRMHCSWYSEHNACTAWGSGALQGDCLCKCPSASRLQNYALPCLSPKTVCVCLHATLQSMTVSDRQKLPRTPRRS